MVTINNLEVSFEVEGEGEDAAFVKLFEKYIKQWSKKQELAKARERRSASERALGDRNEESY